MSRPATAFASAPHSWTGSPSPSAKASGASSSRSVCGSAPSRRACRSSASPTAGGQQGPVRRVEALGLHEQRLHGELDGQPTAVRAPGEGLGERPAHGRVGGEGEFGRPGVGVERGQGVQHQTLGVGPLGRVEIDDLHLAGRQRLGQLRGQFARHIGEQLHRFGGGERLEHLPYEAGRFVGGTYRAGSVDIRHHNRHRLFTSGEFGADVVTADRAQSEMIGDEPQDLCRGAPRGARYGGRRQVRGHGRRVQVVQRQLLAVAGIAHHQEAGDQARAPAAGVSGDHDDARGAGPPHPPGRERAERRGAAADKRMRCISGRCGVSYI